MGFSSGSAPHAPCRLAALPTFARARRLDTLFRHVAEYVSKDALDFLLCFNVQAAAEDDGRLLVQLSGGPQAAAGGGGGGGGSPRRLTAEAATAAAVPPLVLRNDVNLLQILDTAKLMMDY